MSDHTPPGRHGRLAPPLPQPAPRLADAVAVGVIGYTKAVGGSPLLHPGPGTAAADRRRGDKVGTTC